MLGPSGLTCHMPLFNQKHRLFSLPEKLESTANKLWQEANQWVVGGGGALKSHHHFGLNGHDDGVSLRCNIPVNIFPKLQHGS